jgi:cytochrome c-type biogenesis protein CcmH
MMLILLLGGLACAALLPLALPLLRRAWPVAESGSFDRAVYRDQLRELDRDVARGLLTETEAVTVRLEVQRRLLAAGSRPGTKTAVRSGSSPVLASLVVLFAAGGSVAVYAQLGAPGIPDTSASPRTSASTLTAASGAASTDAPAPPGHPDILDQHDLAQALGKLAAKLKADPSNADGWVLYARTAGSLHRWDHAADAYRHALALGRSNPDIQAGLGETLTLQADGIVTPAAHDAFVVALKDDPKNDVAQYYLGIAAGQAGEPAQAIARFQALLGDIPQDSPMRDEIGKRIAEAAAAAGLPVPQLATGTPAEVPDPDAAAMAEVASMPAGEQKTMIAGMVAKLAARLEVEPRDAEGWMRLGRAYVVMGDRDKGADAYERAVALEPGELGVRLQVVEGLLTGLKPDDALPPRAVAMLRQVETIAPEEPEVLWYLGVAAARDAHPADAKQYWARLLAKLPAGGEDAKMVKGAMDQLKGG